MGHSRSIAVVLAATLFSYIVCTQASGEPFAQNPPSVVSHLAPIGTLAPQTRLTLSIGLPLRNESSLDELLRELSDPASPNYRHYLTPGQFSEQFGPSEADYQTVENFFRANGFTVTGEHPSHLDLEVSGSASDVERAFHVTMRTYRHPIENRTFFSPDTNVSLNLTVPIVHISGLDNYSLKRPKMVRQNVLKKITNQPRKTGSGPGGAYMGKDFRAAYLPGVTLTGTGQTLGLLEFDGYYASDVATYESDAGLSGVTLTNVAVSGGVSTPGSGNGEVALDIEVAMSVAPGLSKIVVYEAPDTTSFDTILAAMADDTNDACEEFSCSWGETSAGRADKTGENLFKQMAAQGQSFFDAVGDSDAFVGGIPFPSESTNITQVGGTTLTTTGPGGAWVEDVPWNWGGDTPSGSTFASTSSGTSGGISKNFSIPYWQAGISMTNNLGSTTMRNVPDVAMTGDNIFIVADDGSSEVAAGTSCAAPAWAAIAALANQQAASNGKGPAGFINPTIYAAAKSASYLSYFDDITTGNIFWASSTNLFPSAAGYDLCTGWGTPSGDNLIDLLAGVSDALDVGLGRGFVAFGPAGGPFTATTATFSLTNSGASSLNWSLVNTSAWLNASVAGGTLSPGGGATQETLSLNSAANALPPGTYTASVVFTNQTSHAVRVRQFPLLVGQSLVQNGDFDYMAAVVPTYSAFSYWAQSGSAVSFNSDFVDDGSNSGISPLSGDFAALGSANSIGYISQSIPTVPGQYYLISFWLTNPQSGSTELFFVNWLTNSATTNTIYNIQNPPAFGWTYTNFMVKATSTNTLLQFGARNDPDYFGLDNVSLIPVPSPNINLSRISKNAFSMSWNSVTGMVYQLQYSTNLVSTNWFPLNTNTAAGATLTITNTVGTNPWLFYRVLGLP